MNRLRFLPLLLTIGLASDAQSFQISVNVDLVLLNPTVRDRRGNFIADLQENNFQIYEGGVRQKIQLFRHEDVPVTVGIVVDHSGSMRSKLGEVISAARAFVRSSNSEDQMFVVNFNEHVTLGLPIHLPFTHRPEELVTAILRSPVTGRTALYDAVAEALERLQQGAREKKVLLVISDGGDNASTHSLAEVVKLAGKSSALIYTIGIFEPDDPERNPRVLRRLAHTTGGDAFFPEQLSEIVKTCENIARDIRNQYTIGYVSAHQAKPGTFRSIRLVAKAEGKGKLRVRMRSGYIARGDVPSVEGKGSK